MPEFVKKNLWIRVPLDLALLAFAIYMICTDPGFYGSALVIAIIAVAIFKMFG